MSSDAPSKKERKHHRYSPSTLPATEACAGFQTDSTGNAKSERGQFLHDCIETNIKDQLLDPTLDDDEVVVVRSCATFVTDRMEEMGPDTELLIEEHVKLDDQETTSGYIDIGLVNRKTRQAKIIDWKTGLHPVDSAANNLQGIAYMLGLVHLIPEITECEVVFVMPFQGAGGVTDAHTFHASEFSRLYLRVVTVVARAMDVTLDFNSGEILSTYPSKLNPSDGTCLFCLRKSICPALHALVLQAGKKYDPLIVPDQINPMLIKDARQAGAALKFFSVMEGLAKAYRARAAEKALNDPGEWMPEGYMLTTMTARRITDNIKFAETIRPLLTLDEFVKVITFHLGPVEAAIKAKTPLGQKAEAVAELDRLLRMNEAVVESEPVIQLRQKKSMD